MALTILFPSGGQTTFTAPINRDLPLTEIADAMSMHEPTLGRDFIPEIVKGLDEEGRLVLMVCDDNAHPRRRAPNPAASAYYDRLALLNGYHPNPGRPSMAGPVALITAPDRIRDYPHKPGMQIGLNPDGKSRTDRLMEKHAADAVASLGLTSIALRDHEKPVDVPGGGQFIACLQQMTETGVWESVDHAGPFNARDVAAEYGRTWANRKNQQCYGLEWDVDDEPEDGWDPGHYHYEVAPLLDPMKVRP